jgi:putative membrane protein
MFVDILTAQLFAMALVGLIVLYASVKAYYAYRMARKGGSTVTYEDVLNEIYYASIPVTAIGFYVLLTSIWGQFVWPLPGSYNILFYDPLALGGLVAISAGLAFYKRLTLQLDYVGFFALLVGLVVIYYGYEGFREGLTQEPLALFALYLFFGLAAILSFPYLLSVRRLAGGVTKVVSPYLFPIIVLFWITLLLGSLLSAYIGLSAVPAHLAHPP